MHECFYQFLTYGIYIANYFLHNRFVATLASKDLVDSDTVRIFEFDKHFNLTQAQVCNCIHNTVIWHAGACLIANMFWMIALVKTHRTHLKRAR